MLGTNEYRHALKLYNHYCFPRQQWLHKRTKQTCEFHYITQKVLHSEGVTEVQPILKHSRAQREVRMPAG